MDKVRALALVLGVGTAVLATNSLQAYAQGDDDPDAHKLTMHQLSSASPLPKAHKNFSRFTYRPAGDKVVEQPEANRLMFWTKDGKPDGYAEQHGNSIFYHDSTGRVSRVQELDPVRD